MCLIRTQAVLMHHMAKVDIMVSLECQLNLLCLKGSKMTVLKSKFSANKFWEDILAKISNVNGVIPTLVTDSLTMGFNADASVDCHIVTQGGSPVFEFGIVWATHDNPTIDDNKVVSSSDTFFFTQHVTGLPYPETVYFAAYATNGIGTGYGNVLSGDTQICFAAGTLITKIDGGKKKIEDLKYSDDLLVWNFDKSVFDEAKPVWMVKPFKSFSYALLKFSDGTELKTVADGRGHRIFNYEKGLFTYSTTEDTPINTTTFTEDKDLVKLVSVSVVKEETTFYNVITHTHMNVFANGILTSTGLNNIYPIINMKFVKDNRELVGKKQLDIHSEALFVGLRLSEQPQSYEFINNKIKMMIDRKL